MLEDIIAKYFAVFIDDEAAAFVADDKVDVLMSMLLMFSCSC